MSDHQGSESGKEGVGGERPAEERSILRIIERKIGATTNVSLHEQESDGASAPITDPRSEEKQALPQGRGHYHFSGEIARGGMGVVLKGHDEDLGRDNAVKVLHRELADRCTRPRHLDADEAQSRR